MSTSKIEQRAGNRTSRPVQMLLAAPILLSLLVVAHGGARAEGSAEKAASAAAFLTASKVFFSPRCINCHPAGDHPLQGDQGRPHAMSVKRGPDGAGKVGMRCSGCHQHANQDGLHMPPGGPDWRLPPESEPMTFEGTTAHQLCLHLKDPAKNGNRTPKEVVDHVRTAPLVLWGWEPGEGRAPVPMAHKAFVRLMEEWAEKGAACPD